MITYVNTVLVGKGAGVAASLATTGYETKAEATADANKFVIEDNNNTFRVGLITNKTVESHINNKHVYMPIVKWSNTIQKDCIKSFTCETYKADTQDKITVTFSSNDDAIFANEPKRVVLRLTFKDLPTRYRKWSESYEIVTEPGDQAADIAMKLKDEVYKNYKRARVDAEVSGNGLILTAMEYDDDNTTDSISWANTVRFTANVWYTSPQASGFDSKNKYTLPNMSIAKEPGKIYTGSWKLVRDAEAQAMGYQGILNRGECTWPIIKPDMNVEVNGEYNTLTLEFENMYRAADDIQRKTKQTLQIFYKEDDADILEKIGDVAGIDAEELPEVSSEPQG